MKILIVEDEAKIAQYIEKVTTAILGDKVTATKIIPDLVSALYYLDTHTIDLLLLDLNLNGEDGFGILQELVATSFHTIIISANKHRAIEAFEHGVLDFIPKPFTKERLQKAFERWNLSEKRAPHPTKKLAIRSKGKIKLVDINEVLYIKAANVYATLHLKNGEQELHDKSLDKLQMILPPEFIRIHKSYMVDIHQIKNILIHQGSKYEAVLGNEVIIPIGRTYYKQLKEQWN
ncbi:LytTR family DNA-binding domain-containing protein [uncultured Microscilla sp.]|uniref:LytR/AlgR family response regulator transcription factor n=1 Tax=uncultured Microscilla sp. TaxID=432653 RepID=UPI0026100E61|nr:LytTR family DNA-binding domain-containing protein [uncultured Microscilla sp.]